MGVVLTYADGSTFIRNNFFVFVDGEWKHRFSQEEDDLVMPDVSYEEFAGAQWDLRVRYPKTGLLPW